MLHKSSTYVGEKRARAGDHTIVQHAQNDPPIPTLLRSTEYATFKSVCTTNTSTGETNEGNLQNQKSPRRPLDYMCGGVVVLPSPRAIAQLTAAQESKQMINDDVILDLNAPEEEESTTYIGVKREREDTSTTQHTQKVQVPNKSLRIERLQTGTDEPEPAKGTVKSETNATRNPPEPNNTNLQPNTAIDTLAQTRYQLEEELLRKNAENRQNELSRERQFLQEQMDQTNATIQDHDGNKVPDSEEAADGVPDLDYTPYISEPIPSEDTNLGPAFAVEVRSILICIPIIALARHRQNQKDYPTWISKTNVFRFRIEQTDDEASVIIGTDGVEGSSKLSTSIYVKKQEYLASKKMVLLEFGGFRFDCDVNFKVTHEEKGVPTYPDGGYVLLRESIKVSDFDTTLKERERPLNQMGEFDTGDDDPEIQDCYVDSTRLQLFGTKETKPGAQQSSERPIVKWFMNARQIKTDELWKLRDATNAHPITEHEFDVDEIQEQI